MHNSPRDYPSVHLRILRNPCKIEVLETRICPKVHDNAVKIMRLLPFSKGTVSDS